MIYADHNATTPLSAPVREAMQSHFEVWGNPSSSHQMGRAATQALHQAREAIARACEVPTSQVVFTSGGSEANTLALMGSLFVQPRPFRFLTTGVEHSSVRDTATWMQSQGASVLHLAVNREGEMDLDQVESLIQSASPELVSVMAANNETGVILPIPEVAAICRRLEVPLHVDAVQALGKLPASHWNGADTVAISAHKIGGPKGVGALLISPHRKLIPTHYGGSQEIKRRGGTENFLGAVGFGAACAHLPNADTLRRIEGHRDRFEERLLAELTEFSIQGARARRLVTTSNIRFFGIASEILLSALDIDGLCVSAGSACSSGSITPSHVLLAMGLSPVEARECVRFSWGAGTTGEQVDRAAELVIHHVKRIRSRRKTSV